MSKYTETAPSGIKVESTEPFIEPRWWDNPWLHPVWSYTSWATMIIRDVTGWKTPRRLFDKHWQR